jgi:2-polyprenyl-3-methyl-5-hydroxy-6-metoxy-1,4-benzoquinol methylase
MKGYTRNAAVMRSHIDDYRGDNHPHIIEINKLKVADKRGTITPIKETPHYQYVLGNKQPYLDFLREDHPNEYNESISSFEYLINSELDYLDSSHKKYNGYAGEDSFIIHDDYIIRDGVHRATLLTQLGITHAPVLRVAPINHKTRIPANIESYINQHKDTFPEWYSCFTLGPISIPARTYPTFTNRIESLEDDTMGYKKWELIIKPNLPDLTGKTVCDIGANIGIFSIEMGRLGAKRVDGFDRGPDVVQPNNHNLGSQSVPQQAYFVKNLCEKHYGKKFPHVNFYETDLMTHDFTKERYDVFFSCCVLYHLGPQRMEEIIRDVSKHTPEIFLQANNGHGEELGSDSSITRAEELIQKYGYSTKIVDHGPPEYDHPIVYGVKNIG